MGTHPTLSYSPCWLPFHIAGHTLLELSLKTAPRVDRTPNLMLTELLLGGGVCVVCLQVYFALRKS